MLAFLFLLCYIMQAWFVGQAVKTPPSHGGIRGSIPLRTAQQFYIFLHFSDLTGLHCKLIHDLIQFCHNIVQAFDRSMDIFHLHALLVNFS